METDLRNLGNSPACEYCLLDSVLTKYAHTNWLLQNEYHCIDIPPFVCIFDKETFLNSLLNLFSNGYLSAKDNTRKNIIHLNDKDIKSALFSQASNRSNQGFYFFLTSKGGERWESLSNPNWSIYTTVLWHNYETNIPGIYEAAILGNQKSWMQKRLNTFCATPDSEENLYPKILTKKTSNSALRQPIYWKNIKDCYCIRFQYELVDKSLVDKKIVLHKRNMIDELLMPLETYWYTHPYEGFCAEVKQALRNQGHDI